jgi:hypothetical protein
VKACWRRRPEFFNHRGRGFPCCNMIKRSSSDGACQGVDIWDVYAQLCFYRTKEDHKAQKHKFETNEYQLKGFQERNKDE